jgi:Zn finger protein HypA/HybF involved in hydrogenase expression
MNLEEIFKAYSNESKAMQAFKAMREEQGVVCKKCQSTAHYWKSNKNHYQCKSCKFRTGL